MTDRKNTPLDVGREKARLAATCLQHLLNINPEDVSVDAISDSIERNLLDAATGNPADYNDMLLTQAQILDAVFYYFLEKSKKAYSPETQINNAMKAQRHSQSAISAWGRLGRHKNKNWPKRTGPTY